MQPSSPSSGANVVSVMRRLGATTNRTEKEQILIDAFMAGNTEFFIGARMACDILVTFGIAKVALIQEDDGDLGTFFFNDFIDLTDKLRKRELTGHAARDAIHEAASRCHVPTWNEFYRRILLKDLGVGVETSTINKVLKKLSSAYPQAADLMIPTFECQLAHDGATDQHAKKVAGRKMLDVKLDGVRLLTVLDKDTGTITQYTRNGKVNENFASIRNSLMPLLEKLPGSVVLDGEVVGKNFQELMTQVNRKDKVDDSSARLAVFDIIPLADFKAGLCKTSQEDRHGVLVALEEAGMLSTATNGLVYLIPKIVVDLRTPEGRKRFEEFNKETVLAGYEGIMVKDPAAPYEGKRSAAWLKIKPFIEVSLEIIAAQEGKEGKYAGLLGAFVCRGEEDGRIIEVNVGSGFTDEQRYDFWLNQNAMIGMIVEVRADAMTKEVGSDVWSLRFPRFKGFRGSVPGEKV